MTRTVDLVIYCHHDGDDVGVRDGPPAGCAMSATVIEAIRRRRRVLVVLGSGDRRVRHHLRRCLAQAAVAPGQLSIVSNAEIACVDGIDRVEAVVLRYRRSGRVCAVNASEFRVFVTAPTA